MAEPVFTTSGLGFRMEGAVAPDFNLSLEQHIDATATDDDLNEIADRMRKVLWRQQAQYRRNEAIIDMNARRESIETLPKRLADYQKQRADEKMRITASYQAQHQAAMTGKRNVVEFVNWPKHAEMIEKLRLHDEATGNEIARLNALVEEDKKAIPTDERRIRVQERIIAGEDRGDAVLAEGEFWKASLPQAAE